MMNFKVILVGGVAVYVDAEDWQALGYILDTDRRYQSNVISVEVA